MARSLNISLRNTVASVAIMVASLVLLPQIAFAAEPAIAIPPPAESPAAEAQGLQKVVIAGGCFWGVQGVFQHVKGVTSAVSGFAIT